MNSVHINKLDVLGEKIDLYVDNSGTFRAEYQGVEYHAATAADVHKMLTKAVRADKESRAVSVSILDHVPNPESKDSKNRRWGSSWEPFVSGRGVVHGKLRGRHGHHHEWLLEADGKKFTVRCYDSDNVICLRLSPTRVKEYLTLAEAFDRAKAALTAWKEENTVDAKEIARLCRL